MVGGPENPETRKARGQYIAQEWKKSPNLIPLYQTARGDLEPLAGFMCGFCRVLFKTERLGLRHLSRLHGIVADTSLFD